MIKNISRIIAVLGTVLIIFSASPMDVHATEYDYSGYTQDDYLQMILDANKKYGINSEDYYGGGVHPEVKSYNSDGTLQNSSNVMNDSTNRKRNTNRRAKTRT